MADIVQRMRKAYPAERAALSAFFLAHGFLLGSWAPKIPEFALRLGLDESALGLVILFFGSGSLVAMPLVSVSIARRGSRPILVASAMLSLLSLPIMTFVPGVAASAVGLFVVGALVGCMDVATNANAVEVERRLGRAIMSAFHGFWSLGGVIGAGLGGFMIEAAGVQVHALAATLILALAIFAAAPKILSDSPSPAKGGGVMPSKDSRLRALFSAGLPVWLIGVMCLFSMTPEGAVLDWGALYLRNELDASVGLSGLAFSAFAGTMALMRFLGDGIRDRLGPVLALQLSCLFAMAGLLIAGLAGHPFTAIFGFAVTGIGIANLIPIAFSAAGALPGLPQGLAIAVVTSMGYSGILVAPSVIGFIAEQTGFAVIFAVLPVLLAVVLALSRLARHAEHRPPEAQNERV